VELSFIEAVSVFRDPWARISTTPLIFGGVPRNNHRSFDSRQTSLGMFHRAA
jgi:hypothetical protein